MKQTVLVMGVVLLMSSWGLLAAAGQTKVGEKKSLGSTETGDGAVQWLRYDEGLAKAKKEDKHIFVNFTTSWCGWCRKMDAETFAKEEVIGMLNEHFVPVEVDGESKRELNIDGYKISEKNLTKYEFGVRAFPSFWFLKSDGSKLAVIRGYRNPEFMMEAFEYVKDRKYDSTSTDSSDEEDETKP